MNRIDLTLPNKKGQGHTHHLTGPSGWQEVSGQQFMALCKVLMLIGQHAALRLSLPHILYKLSHKHAALLFDADALREAGYPDVMRDELLSAGYNLLQTTDWVFTTLPQRWPFGLVPADNFGPGDGLEALSFGEFVACERLADRFRSGDETALPQLIAHLCVTKLDHYGKPIAKRRPAEEWELEPAARVWSSATRVEQWAWWFAYECNRQVLTDTFPDLFPKTNPADQDERPQLTPKANWSTLAMDMAEGSVERFQINERAPVYLVLALLNRQLQKADD